MATQIDMTEPHQEKYEELHVHVYAERAHVNGNCSIDCCVSMGNIKSTIQAVDNLRQWLTKEIEKAQPACGWTGNTKIMSLTRLDG